MEFHVSDPAWNTSQTSTQQPLAKPVKYYYSPGFTTGGRRGGNQEKKQQRNHTSIQGLMCGLIREVDGDFKRNRADKAGNL